MTVSYLTSCSSDHLWRSCFFLYDFGITALRICKDSSRKFCPSCGGPTLLRASVTISSPRAGPNTPAVQVHLKKNFQFKTRGTIYSIPAPKPGSAKTGPGEGLILREDQAGWQRAKKRADGKREL